MNSWLASVSSVHASRSAKIAFSVGVRSKRGCGCAFMQRRPAAVVVTRCVANFEGVVAFRGARPQSFCAQNGCGL